jgi:hypothetical protein
VKHCLDLMAKGKTGLSDCIALCMDCAETCGLCDRVQARGGPMAAVIQAACAKVCTACAEDCEKHAAVDPVMKACAEACRACAKDCAG